MIRCPFNNFSKCDGNCPFSMPNFTGCRIATSLTTIEGIARGMDETGRKTLAKVGNVELFLEQSSVARDDYPNVPSNGTSLPKLVSDTSKNRLMIRFGEYTKTHSPDIRIALTPETFNEAKEMFGEKVFCQVMQNGTVIVTKGDSLKLSDNKGTGQISLSTYSDTFLKAYGVKYGVVYLKKTVIDQMMILARDESVPIADQCPKNPEQQTKIGED